MAVEAKKREILRETMLMRVVRFGLRATQESFDERMTQLEFELRKYEEEY